MTRSQLIAEIMAQVCSVTDETDFALRLAVEKRLHRTPFAVLREIYATNAVQRAVEIGQRKFLSSLPTSNPEVR